MNQELSAIGQLAILDRGAPLTILSELNKLYFGENWLTKNRAAIAGGFPLAASGHGKL